MMFLVCGEALIDMFEDADNSLAFQGRVAGSPFNTAIGLARLGCQTFFTTCISHDAFGERIIAALERERVDWRFAQRTLRPTILSVVLSTLGSGVDYAFYGEGGADADLRPEGLPDSLPDEILAVHCGGFPLAVEPARSAYAGLIRREAPKRFISIDPNIRPALIGGIDAFRDHFEGLCPSLALVKASAEDISLLYEGVDAMTIARRWRSLGASCVVVTEGAKGAFALNDHGVVLSKSRAVTVVDTVGAGDSFMAALLACLARQQLLERHRLAAATPDAMKSLLDVANRAAGITCTRRGANPPGRAELFAA